jgi:prepilin-type N-terminal cleavage/methylation domain-containing protein
MKRKGFTLVELLVVIAIIALLMGILMPALSKVRQLALRLFCGANLSGIGKAMLIYANDEHDELPIAGLKDSTLGLTIPNWMAPSRQQAFYSPRVDKTATITSCFYLLIKYGDVTPKQFVCKSDTGTTPLNLTEEEVPAGFELIDAWDFGSNPTSHCSYSYHNPFSKYPLRVSQESALPMAADRNPWINGPGADARELSTFIPDISPYNGTSERAKNGSSNAHQMEGQNVLYLDGSVSFEKRAYCGIEDDNIYTSAQNGSVDPIGRDPKISAQPVSIKDSVLINIMTHR